MRQTDMNILILKEITLLTFKTHTVTCNILDRNKSLEILQRV